MTSDSSNSKDVHISRYWINRDKYGRRNGEEVSKFKDIRDKQWTFE